MKVVNHVNQTSDYSMFKELKGNRHVNKLHVKRLKDSFQKAYLFTPIIVNEGYEIIDGQHRFEAAKQIGLAINFIVVPNYGLKEVQMLNEHMKNWSKGDYLNAYCDLGNPEYLKFKKFMRDYPEFKINACESILTNKTTNGAARRNSIELKNEENPTGSYPIRYFQEGELVIPDYNHAVTNAEKIMMIKPYYEGFNRNIFVRVMISLFRIEYYNHDQLVERIKANPTAMQHCQNVTQYKLLVEDIYNFRSRDKVSLRF